MKKQCTYTPDPINPHWLTENDILVFGSNTEGRHGAGLARYALDYRGAMYGTAVGPQGYSYAIVTKNLAKGMRSVSLESIDNQIHTMLIYAEQHPELIFWVGKIGTKLAGFTIDEIKNMFTNKRIPDNVHLPIEFVDKPVLNIQTWPQYVVNNALNIPELRVLDFRWLSSNFNTFNHDLYAYEFIQSKLSLF